MANNYSADGLPMRAQAGSAASAQGPVGDLAPFSGVTQGAAPAGLVPSEAELPVVSVHGGDPMTLNGYSASGGQAPLPPPGSDEGSGLPPSGRRR